jgi:MFS-type transporter involved in bile tolerance (Atg22 family)
MLRSASAASTGTCPTLPGPLSAARRSACRQLFVPGTTIAYFMIGLPAESFAFFALTAYATSLTAESMISFITKFTKNAAYAVVVSQVRTHELRDGYSTTV